MKARDEEWSYPLTCYFNLFASLREKLCVHVDGKTRMYRIVLGAGKILLALKLYINGCISMIVINLEMTLLFTLSRKIFWCNMLQ